MSSDIAIKVENLGKSYQIGHNLARNERYTALRDVITHNAKNLARKTRDMFQGKAIVQGDEVEEFWALKDLNFEIKQGDRVGIIGRNGAGKSTLLKILSRITEPTNGRITLNGRVASLLEVGTGFHPELSGRENIFLNGAILGMSRGEIQRKFDEIVEFAEVEKFLDTPVKRYSSGMYVRLAFAVAAHLEPEILVVDEVLAVGDVAFQKKCLGKMDEVSKEGRTVLFVSHNMAAIKRLCCRAVLLTSGKLKKFAETSEVIDEYLLHLEKESHEVDIFTLPRSGDGRAIITGFGVVNNSGERVSSVCTGDDVSFIFDYNVKCDTELKGLSIGFSLHNGLGDTLSVFYSGYAGHFFDSPPGPQKIACKIKKMPLSPGNYYIGARMVCNGIEVDWPKGFIGSFQVDSGDFYRTGQMHFEGIGPLMLDGEWR